MLDDIYKSYLNFSNFFKPGSNQVSYIAFGCYVYFLFLLTVRKAWKCLLYRWGKWESGRWSNLPDYVTLGWESQAAFICLCLPNMSLLPLSCISLPYLGSLEVAFPDPGVSGPCKSWAGATVEAPTPLPSQLGFTFKSLQPHPRCNRDWENIPPGYLQAHPRRLKEEP